MYKEELESIYGAAAASVRFRSKVRGWRQFSMDVAFSNGSRYQATQDMDSYLLGFHLDLFNRPSCHRCTFRELRSGADLTLGDYWGIERQHPQMDDDRGTSVVLVNTVTGSAAFAEVAGDVGMVESRYDELLPFNPALHKSFPAHSNRAKFFKDTNTRPLSRRILKALRPSLLRRLRVTLGACYRRVHGMTTA